MLEGSHLPGVPHVQDKQDMIFGGNDSPCALAQLNSLGAIELENNRMFSAAFADLISEHDIPGDRCGPGRV